ncbi:hypothetical protein YC2023_043010 [Brassica napus]
MVVVFVIELENPIENIGAMIVRQAAFKLMTWLMYMSSQDRVHVASQSSCTLCAYKLFKIKDVNLLSCKTPLYFIRSSSSSTTEGSDFRYQTDCKKHDSSNTD